jgi:hypothetical protein
MKKIFRIIAMESNLAMESVRNIEHVISSMTCPDDFNGLQDFLHQETDGVSIQNLEFLMVTPDSFGKVKILDLGVEDNYVILQFLDCTTLSTGNVRIAAGEVSPSVLFIRWNDLKRMMLGDSKTSTYMDELLEFDF